MTPELTITEELKEKLNKIDFRLVMASGINFLNAKMIATTTLTLQQIKQFTVQRYGESYNFVQIPSDEELFEYLKERYKDNLFDRVEHNISIF